jgi:hypothetical protein
MIDAYSKYITVINYTNLQKIAIDCREILKNLKHPKQKFVDFMIKSEKIKKFSENLQKIKFEIFVNDHFKLEKV